LNFREVSGSFRLAKLCATSSQVFKDIIDGNNITAKSGGCTAGPGWDARTGLGVPMGNITGIL